MNEPGVKPPPGLRAGGKRLWSSVADAYELEEHEARLLLEACRTTDLLDQLAAAVTRDGPLCVDGKGEPKAHPAAVEARQQRIALARLIAALRLPAGDEDDLQKGARRPQRRLGARGVYGLRVAK